MRGFRCIGRYRDLNRDLVSDEDVLFFSCYESGEDMRSGNVRGRDLKRLDHYRLARDVIAFSPYDYVFVAIAVGEDCFK